MSHNEQMNDTIFRFPNGSLAAIAGRPGTGKTALALQIAARNAQSGKRVLFFSGNERGTREEANGTAGIRRAGTVGGTA